MGFSSLPSASSFGIRSRPAGAPVEGDLSCRSEFDVAWSDVDFGAAVEDEAATFDLPSFDLPSGCFPSDFDCPSPRVEPLVSPSVRSTGSVSSCGTSRSTFPGTVLSSSGTGS